MKRTEPEQTAAQFIAEIFDADSNPATKRGRHHSGTKAELPSLPEADPLSFAEQSASAALFVSVWLDTDDPIFCAACLPGDPDLAAAVQKGAEDLARALRPETFMPDDRRRMASSFVSEGPRPARSAALLARLDGGPCFSAAGGRILLKFSPSGLHLIEQKLENDREKSALKKHRRRPVPGAPLTETAAADDDIGNSGLSLPCIRIGRNPEFVIGRLFMPSIIALASSEARIFWNGLSLCSGQQPDADGAEKALPFDGKLDGCFWFEARLNAEGRRCSFQIAVPEPSAGKTAAESAILASYRDHVALLLEAGWRSGARFISSALKNAGIEKAGAELAAVLPASDTGAASGKIILEGEACVGSAVIPLVILLPDNFQALLVSLCGIKSPARQKSESLARLMAANDELLGRWAQNYRKPYMQSPHGEENSGGRAALPCLADVIGLLGDRDAAIILNNLCRERAGSGLIARFFWTVPVQKELYTDYKPILLHPFHESRILRLLSSVAAETWKAEKLKVSTAYSRDRKTCAEASRASLTEICAAVKSGRLALSPAGENLLRSELFPLLEAEERAELTDLASKDIPFGFMAALDMRDRRRLLGLLSNRELALASLGPGDLDESETDRGGIRNPAGILNFMSRRRARDFEDEVEAASARLRRGEISVAALIQEKQRVLNKMQEKAACLPCGRDENIGQ